MALALSGVPAKPDERVLVGNSTADDAGIFLISPDRALVQTVDVLAPIADDPYTFGKIAAINSLSDVWAMGGTPLSALGVIGYPMGGDPEVMTRILCGGQDAVVEVGAAIVGGHSFVSDEIRYGLAVTGEIDPREIFTNAGARPGDALILTKSLGIGTIVAAAVSRGALPPLLMETAIASMLVPNRRASDLMRRYRANACTDVTGFGLLGHGTELAIASNVKIIIHSEKIPALPGVMDLIIEKQRDPAGRQNSNSFKQYIEIEEGVSEETTELLFGSETSGGLLISLPMDRAIRYCEEFGESERGNGVIIGEIEPRNNDEPYIIVKG